MVKLTQDGTYRGKILEHGVSETKNGYPQFVAHLAALEIWDDDKEQWVDFSEYDAGMMGYFVLIGGDAKPLLNMDQVMKATGWDGQSFAALDNMDLSKTIVQFQVAWNEYDGKESLQVSWIDHEDATPGIKVKKLDQKELKSLDAKYGATLKAASGKATPVASKKKSVPTPLMTATEATSEKPKRGRGRPPKKVEESEIVTSDIEDAWGAFAEHAGKMKLDGDHMNKIWLSTVENIVGEKDEDDITGEEWGQIKTALLNCDGIPF